MSGSRCCGDSTRIAIATPPRRLGICPGCMENVGFQVLSLRHPIPHGRQSVQIPRDARFMIVPSRNEQSGVAKRVVPWLAFALILPDFTHFSHQLSCGFASIKVFGEASHRYVLCPSDNVHAVPPYSASDLRGAAYAAA